MAGSSKVAWRETKNRILVALLCVVHFSFSILFFALGYRILCIYNLFSTVLYFILALCYTLEREFAIMAVVAVEIPVYSVLVTLFLGNYSGALFFSFGMLAAVFLFAVNKNKALYNYILLSIPSIGTAFFVALWEAEPFLGTEIRFEFWFGFHRIYTLTISIVALLYLCISGNLELAAVQRKNDQLIGQLQYMSTHDSLTGIPNRRFLLQQVKTTEKYAAAIFDVDDFKKINDTYGHETGDRVLCRIVRRVASVIPQDAVFARWGGEEFLVIFPDKTAESVHSCMDNVIGVVCENDFAFETETIHVSITAGVADSTEAGSFSEVVAFADSRLYKGKHSGKNQVVFS